MRMYVISFLILIIGLGGTGSYLYAKTKNQEIQLVKLSAEREDAIHALESEQRTVKALELKIEMVQVELGEIQVLKDKQAETSALLADKLKIQTKMLKESKNDETEYQLVLSEIIAINESYKECMQNNLTNGTIGPDGFKTFRVGQSLCFSEFRNKIDLAASEQNRKAT